MTKEMRRIVESMESTLHEKVEINQELVNEAFELLSEAGLAKSDDVVITESEEGRQAITKMVETLDSAAYLLRSSLG